MDKKNPASGLVGILGVGLHFKWNIARNFHFLVIGQENTMGRDPVSRFRYVILKAVLADMARYQATVCKASSQVVLRMQ